MNNYPAQHLARVKAALDPANQVRSVADYLEKYTRLDGKPWSFKDHEYQKFILGLEAEDIVVKKSSQVGISELSLRRALALCNIHPGIGVAYVLPTFTFAQLFTKTRVDVTIEGSPEVRAQVTPGADSAQVKRFLNGSILYIRGSGAHGSGQAQISIPLSALVIDECDFFEDYAALSQYTSRLTHSKIGRNVFTLSTPTLPKFGISARYEHSRQYEELQRCSRCNHWFEPNYYEQVRLPGFDKPLSTISAQTKRLIDGFDLKTAYLECPKCKKPVDQGVENRRWVLKNPESNASAVGVHVTPFSAPAIVPPGALIRASTEYVRSTDFKNFALGLEAEDKESAVSKAELQALVISEPGFNPAYTVMGLDLGGTCACHIAAPTPEGPLVVVHSEMIPLHQLKVRYKELCARHRVICAVADAVPYTSLVAELQEQDPNLWASLFSGSNSTNLYRIVEREEDETKALYGVRRVDVARDLAFDTVVAALRAANILFVQSDETDRIFDHLIDPKRKRVVDKNGEDVFKWVKTTGEDHYAFALIYLFIASCIKGMSSGLVPLPSLLAKIKHAGKI